MGSVLIISVIILGLLGILFGIGLYIASKKLAVEVDPRVEKITDLLPGANCGGCGNPGCAGFAEKLAQGEAEVDECPVCGAEAKKLICDVLGMEMKESEPNIAVIHCQKETSPPRFEYDGDKTCAAANIVNGGFTTCNFACLGFGDCVESCPFAAIYMGEDGLPHVLKDKCTACGNCVKACPRDIISLAPVSKDVHVLCNSKHNGKDTKTACSHGCIGCKMCERKCPYDAIHVTNFLASIDYDKCVVCGTCVDVCPTGAIGDLSLIKGKSELAKSRFNEEEVAQESA